MNASTAFGPASLPGPKESAGTEMEAELVTVIVTFGPDFPLWLEEEEEEEEESVAASSPLSISMTS